MNLCIFCGARPNFIKVAPIMRELDLRKAEGKRIAYKLVYAGTADDPTVESNIFKELAIRKPDAYLGVDCENLNELTGQVMQKFDEWLNDNPTDTVLVVDDLASTMAAAIVTKKRGLRLARIAAGTRSFDISMPKEVNRLVIDGLSDILFTAGQSNNSIVGREGGELSKVYMVGNVLMDNLRFAHERIEETPLPGDVSPIVENPDGTLKSYLLFTINRKALLSGQYNLGKMMEALLHNAGAVPVIAPLRESAARTIMGLHLMLLRPEGGLHIVRPMGFLEFARLARHACGVITDSGNVAEESTFNGVPCITLNSYTEHIETVTIGSNILVGEDPEKLGKAVSDMVAGHWKSCGVPDRWDGRTASRIVSILAE